MADAKQIKRIIQEYVPGKQITLTHIIANPTEDVYTKLGIENTHDSIGIMTITPAESVIIAADMALKAGGVGIGFMDRFSGTAILHGELTALTEAFTHANAGMADKMHFTVSRVTQN
ncbi:BMC domain-containing protein [Furfurilactobacillus sp. WILCCON 0119]